MNHVPPSSPPSPTNQQGTPLHYEPPRVQDLGAWQAVTLIGSVGFNRFPGLPGQENNRGSY
ncbi:hypothetical protein CBQ26_02735 [Deinococcus indicus]|uniref:Uncharacterized protein n=1 Tax=Deinococcus indicus TaxID=223556 RepID=A0A246BPS3_9DEIO|nr:hypothetical protein [Deinococcus indicus]OWL97242.1 hypothetical protein CBQ26_02735 [Deinococcus indicus]